MLSEHQYLSIALPSQSEGQFSQMHDYSGGRSCRRLDTSVYFKGKWLSIVLPSQSEGQFSHMHDYSGGRSCRRLDTSVYFKGKWLS
jgi:hypothetical protein